MLKILLKSKDVLYQVSSDLNEVNSFYGSLSDVDQEAPPSAFKSLKKPAWYRVNACSMTQKWLLNIAKNQLIFLLVLVDERKHFSALETIKQPATSLEISRSWSFCFFNKIHQNNDLILVKKWQNLLKSEN